MYGFSTSNSQVEECKSTLLLVWKGEKNLIQLMTHDEITHAARNATLMQTIEFIDEHLFIRALLVDAKEAEQPSYEVAALNGKRRRLSRCIEKPLKDDRVRGNWETDLRVEVVSDVRLHLAAGTDEHQGDVRRMAE